MNKLYVWAILLAGGSGNRFQNHAQDPVNKLLISLNNHPVLAWSAQTLLACDAITGLMLVCPDNLTSAYRDLLQTHLTCSKPIHTAVAGASRAQSVASGLDALSLLSPLPEVVLVHDAARPLISLPLIDRVLSPLLENQAEAVIPGLPVRDTIKKITGTWISETIPRENLIAVQTPQAFSFDILHRAHRLAQHADHATDDAQLIEAMGLPVRWVEGDPQNLKLTTPDDLPVLRAFALGQ
jgi:2-C-methyl-D-erythritol 4-phosphate cytidylyltransferase